MEATIDGVQAVWAQARAWEPGQRLVLDWHPGTPEAISTVTLAFSPAPQGCQVTLEHSDWEVFDEPGLARTQYEQAWPLVLAAYSVQFATAAEEPRTG